MCYMLRVKWLLLSVQVVKNPKKVRKKEKERMNACTCPDCHCGGKDKNCLFCKGTGTIKDVGFSVHGIPGIITPRSPKGEGDGEKKEEKK